MICRLIPALLLALVAGLFLAGPVPVEGQAPDDTPAPPAGVDVQARGPVHEAFAEPTVATSPAGPIVDKEPPAPIEEVPPEDKPEGDHIVWIPGYWAWDTDNKEYLWISGFWRAEPPGRTWTPGHWQKVDEGWQWVGGYWALPTATETEYLPEPPPSLDRGPSTEPERETDIYVPGLWVYQTSRYMWRPGYWVAYRPGWVWTPACYRWTPAGYIYVSGFWDVPLLDRGLLFAPVRFTRLVAAGFVYQPTFVIQPDFLLGALFVGTSTGRYYFGNYFEPRFSRTYVTWINYRPARTVYDVNFSYYRAAYHGYPTWEKNLRTLYVGRTNGTIDRPPVTLVEQNKVINNITVNKTTNVNVNKSVNISHLQNVSVLQPISKVHNLQVTALASLASNKPGFVKSAPVHREMKVERLTKAQITAEKQFVTRSRTIANERRAAEAKVITRPAPKPGTARPPVKVKVDLPKGTPPARVTRTPLKAPPPPTRPKVDPKHTPPPRKGPAPPPAKEKGHVEKGTPPPTREKPPPAKDRTPPPSSKDKAPPPKKDKEKPKKDKDK
jgi:hypothetical protein